jgi:predicted ATP-grasp superfamily ATP-dependent carboligase
MAATTVYLIGFAEAVAAPEVCFSLKSTNAQIISFYRHEGKFARLKFVEYFPVAAPEIDFERAVHDVETLVDRVGPDSIAPCDDAALLILSQLKSAKARSLLPTVAACDFAMDKHAQITLASDSGFSVPRTKLVSCEADLADFEARPAILKPRAAIDIVDGRLEKGPSFVVRSDVLPAQARKALAQRTYLMQEYKNGVGEGVFGVARDGDIYASFGHRRLRMMNPSGSGASACVSRTPDACELEAVKTLVQKIQWQGPFMVESLRENAGRRWFMEFNGRFWGSLALARRCGLDMPRLAVDLRNGQPIPAARTISAGFARHLGRDLINLLFVLRGPADGVRSDHWPSRSSAVKDFLTPHRLRSFYNYDPAQPLFFVKDAIYTVSNAILGRKS